MTTNPEKDLHEKTNRLVLKPTGVRYAKLLGRVARPVPAVWVLDIPRRGRP